MTLGTVLNVSVSRLPQLQAGDSHRQSCWELRLVKSTRASSTQRCPLRLATLSAASSTDKGVRRPVDAKWSRRPESGPPHAQLATPRAAGTRLQGGRHVGVATILELLGHSHLAVRWGDNNQVTLVSREPFPSLGRKVLNMQFGWEPVGDAGDRRGGPCLRHSWPDGP